MSIVLGMVLISNHLILCLPFLLLPSIYPRIRVFSNEAALHIKWPKYWSFKISPSNKYSGLPLGLTDLISLQSQGLSRVFYSTTIESISSLVLSLLYDPTFISIHDNWKNHSFNIGRSLLAKWCLCFLIHCLGLT